MSASVASLSEVRTPPPTAQRGRPARRIASDAEAVDAARAVAAEIADGAAERDRERRLPYAEMDLLSDAGLTAITVPSAHGGADVSPGALAEVIATLAAADGSIGQIPQNHFFILEAVRLVGTPDQQRFVYGRILDGDRIGNALSEAGTKTAQDHATRIVRDRDRYRIDGRKFYSTGVLFAHWVAIVGNDADGKSLLAIVPRDAEGVTVVDDWTGFGQRTTGSGTTLLDGVEAPASAVYPLHQVFDTPTPMGPLAQIMHAAVDLGIARGALREAVHFVRNFTRPWKESGNEHGYEDPHIISDIGNLKIQVDAADALVQRSGRFIEAARAAPTADNVAAASIAVAEGKIAANDAALLAGSKLIELGGSRAVLARHGLDRYWRDARTHTVHDPVRWKYRVIGNYWLNGVNPPRHGAL